MCWGSPPASNTRPACRDPIGRSSEPSVALTRLDRSPPRDGGTPSSTTPSTRRVEALLDARPAGDRSVTGGRCSPRSDRRCAREHGRAHPGRGNERRLHVQGHQRAAAPNDVRSAGSARRFAPTVSAECPVRRDAARKPQSRTDHPICSCPRTPGPWRSRWLPIGTSVTQADLRRDGLMGGRPRNFAGYHANEFIWLERIHRAGRERDRAGRSWRGRRRLLASGECRSSADGAGRGCVGFLGAWSGASRRVGGGRGDRLGRRAGVGGPRTAGASGDSLRRDGRAGWGRAGGGGRRLGGRRPSRL